MPNSKSIAPRTRRYSPLFDARGAVVLVALAIAPTSVLAAAQLRGSPEAVSLEAQDASIEEILAALGASFKVHYQSTVKLEKRLTGTYVGSLQRVVMRILEGYNFIAKTNKGKIEITVLGTQIAQVAAAASPASPASKAGPRPPEPAALASASIKVAEAPVPAALPEGLMPVPSRSPGSGPSPFLNAKASDIASPVPQLAPGSAPPFDPVARKFAVAAPMPLTPLAPGSAPFDPEARKFAVAAPMLVTPLAPGSAPPFDPEPRTSAVAPPMLLAPLAPGTAPPLVTEPQTSAVAPPMAPSR